MLKTVKLRTMSLRILLHHEIMFHEQYLAHCTFREGFNICGAPKTSQTEMEYRVFISDGSVALAVRVAILIFSLEYHISFLSPILCETT